MHQSLCWFSLILILVDNLYMFIWAPLGDLFAFQDDEEQQTLLTTSNSAVQRREHGEKEEKKEKVHPDLVNSKK